MKKLKRNKDIIIGVLCITIILMSIGFVFLSTELESKKTEGKMYDVGIVKISEGTAIKGGATLPTGTSNIVNNKSTAKFMMTLNNPKDSLTYNIIIKNNGSFASQIDNIIEVPNYTKNNNDANAILPVVIKHNDIVGQVLKPAEEITLTITAEFSLSGQPMKKVIPYEISILSSCIE